jgi:methionyl-tRNA formyltransferase
MKIVYWGSSESSAEIAQSLTENGEKIILVVSQPTRQKGRGRKKHPTPVSQFAIENKIDLITPDDPNEANTITYLKSLNPDLFFLCAYARILSKDLLDIPSKGAVNLHFSLLPELRGAAPIQRAIMKGYSKTGITTFFMNELLDRGNIILQRELKIKEWETAGELEERLSRLGKIAAIETIEEIKKGTYSTREQNQAKKSYAKKISKEERFIDWRSTALEIVRKINGLSPSPGGVTFFRGKRLILLKARIGQESGEDPGSLKPGKILGVVAGDKRTVLIDYLKPEGKRRITSHDFINGFRVKDGDVFKNQPE